MAFGECQSCVGESLGAASAHRVRRTAHKTEVPHESNVGPAWSNTALHKMLIGYRITSVRLSCAIQGLWTQYLAEAEVPIRAEAEVANCAVDAVPIDPNVRVSEPVEPAAATGGQPAAMEVNTDPVVERVGGAAPQPDVSRARPMEVSLEQRVTTGASKRRAKTQLTPNSVEGYIGGLRTFDGHQDVQNKRDVSD